MDDDTFVRLERLSRKAANDSLRTKGGHLAEDQFDSLAVHLLTIGIRAFDRFDAALTVSDRDALSYAFRAMRGYRDGRFTDGPYVDWIRTNVLDSRFEPKATTSVTASGELPESGALAGQTFDALVHEVSAGLTTRALDALHRYGRPIFEKGLRMADVAGEQNVTTAYVRLRLDELGLELGVPLKALEPEVNLKQVQRWATKEAA